jgi:UDP-glucose 4-epimerase
MKVVITGSESFIGQELKQHCLSRQIDLVGIDLAPSKEQNHLTADIRSPQIGEMIPQGADALIHLAAISRDPDCRANPYQAFEINVLGTLNLIRAAQESGVRQIIFASSEWVYGEVSNDNVQTEDQAIDVTRLKSEYALSKIVSEQNLRMAQQQGLGPVTVLRFGIVYGPRPANWSAVESLFNTVKTQDTVSVGSLGTARRFIHVTDIAAGIIQSIGREGFEIFNLSGDTLITLGDIIEHSAALLGKRPQVVEKNPGSVSIRNPDNRKARQVLGWEPRFDLTRGLESLL